VHAGGHRARRTGHHHGVGADVGIEHGVYLLHKRSRTTSTKGGVGSMLIETPHVQMPGVIGLLGMLELQRDLGLQTSLKIKRLDKLRDHDRSSN
jgi:hypothetical protein